MFPPRKFRPMPTPIEELTSLCCDEDTEAWEGVTNNFSQKTIERFIELYETPAEQKALLDVIEKAYKDSGSKDHRVNFLQLASNISAGNYHKAADDEAEYQEGMDLSYKEQLDNLRKIYEELKRAKENEIRALEYHHQYEVKELRELLENKALEKKWHNDSKVLLFTFTEMVEIVKERFSKGAAEEFCNMLYQLALKHGYLDRGITKEIDGIVPAILQRNALHQTLEFHDTNMVNINP